jgi:small-conductance mechanosensitive channel
MPALRSPALPRFALLLLAVLCAGPVLAQPTAPTAPAQATALAPAQAQQALAVLQDDKRRAELITTLEAIAKAAPAGTAPAGAGAAAAPGLPADGAAKPADAAATPATPSLAPDSVGAQLVGRVSVMLSAYAQQVTASLRSVNDLPLLWRWLANQAEDPAARAAVLDAAGRLLLVLAGALVGEWLVRLLFRRLRATLTGWAPRYSDGDEAGVAHAAAPAETEARRHRFDRALGALRQLPYLLVRLVLDLLPIAAFLAVAEVLLGTGLGASREARLVVLQAVESYVYARVILAVAAFLVSPAKPRLRLLHVSDWAADFLTRWTRRIVIVAVTGIALANIGLLFGMYRTAQMAVLKLFSLLVHLCLVAAVLEARKPVAARLRARRTASGVWARLLNRFAEIWHLVAIFYIVGLWLVWAVEVRNGYERLITFCAVTFAVLVGARLLGILVLGGLDRVRAVLVKDGYATVVDRAGVYYPVLRGVLTAVIWFITAIALLEAWGLPVLFWLTAGGWGGRVFDAMLTVVVAVLLAIVAWEGANAAIARHLAALSSSSQLARAGRLRTLLPFLRTALLITILLIVGMIVLSAIGVNIAPLLAGAGVIGIAVGFGSQKLVQDLITGLFLLLENAMQVGDVVTVAGMTGTVEALSIRTIRLRALDGAVHLIPFSSVTTVTNQTRDYSYAVLDVAVGLNEEPGPVEQVLRDVGAEMQADPDWQSMVLDRLDVVGVEKLGDTAWTLRVRMKTQPGSRWAVARELNRRIKVRFDQLAIESPFTSHRVLSRDAPPPQVASPEEQAA